MTALPISPIGHVRGGRAEAVDDNWGDERARIVLVEAFGPEALFGLADFSHAEVIFQFDKVPDSKIETGARHPRGNKDWPLVGIFAQRGKNRPNRIGLCTCRILGVEGRELLVEGLDAIDGTPVLDIKPVMREFLPREATRQPDWASELMKDYW
ncbi:MAG: SAM-dependent methyltransferase [Hyphomonas sp.]